MKKKTKKTTKAKTKTARKPAAKAAGAKRKCGVCGKRGHNARSHDAGSKLGLG